MSQFEADFFNLDPNLILNCADQNNFSTTGRIQQLNSYENRVYDIELNDNSHIIAKFYRPGRWSKETIRDEHLFELELKEAELQVAGPLKLKDGSTVGEWNGVYFAFFEKVRGRLIQEFLPNDYKRIGQWMAHLHNVGERKVAEHRAFMGPSNDQKWNVLDQLYGQVSLEVEKDYFDAAELIFSKLDDALENTKFMRIHGDLHRGNILETPDPNFVVVDFDDFLNGPAVQDMWMLLPSENYQNSKEFDNLIEGYESLRHFPFEEMSLVPLLRGYRIINYSGWILNRWNDPSFKQLFPQFNSYLYWLEELESLNRIARTL